MPINEQLSFNVSFGGVVKASASTNINDTSRPAYEYILVPTNTSSVAITEIDVPTYHIASNVSSANEGDSILFTLTTTMLDTGTSIPYTITGITAADLSVGSLTGNFITDDTGKATATVTLANDKLTEGTESLVITLNGNNTFKEVSILDTSKAPVYNLNWYSDVNGTNAVTTSNEGAGLYLVLKTQNVADGTVFDLTVSGTGVTAADFTRNNLVGTITISNNIGSINFTSVADKLTENNEVLNGVAKLGTSTVSSATLTLVDTSKAPTFVAGWYANSDGTTPITSINEGSTAYLVVTTTGVTDNTGLGVQFSGTGIALADMSGSAATSTLSSAINIVNNKGYLAVPLIADQSTEGNEVLITKISYFGTEVSSLNLTINDTSILSNGGSSEYTALFTWWNQGGDVYLLGYTDSTKPITQNIYYQNQLLPIKSTYWLNNWFGKNVFSLEFENKGNLNPNTDLNIKVRNLTNGKSTTLTMVNESKVPSSMNGQGGASAWPIRNTVWYTEWNYYGAKPYLITDVLIANNVINIEVLL